MADVTLAPWLTRLYMLEEHRAFKSGQRATSQAIELTSPSHFRSFFFCLGATFYPLVIFEHDLSFRSSIVSMSRRFAAFASPINRERAGDVSDKFAAYAKRLSELDSVKSTLSNRVRPPSVHRFSAFLEMPDFCIVRDERLTERSGVGAL